MLYTLSGRALLIGELCHTIAQIYHQIADFISRIIMAFENSGITYRQLHGDQSTFERTSQLNSFTKDPNVEAFVVSIEAGGVGLNMTCADEVYLMVS